MLVVEKNFEVRPPVGESEFAAFRQTLSAVMSEHTIYAREYLDREIAYLTSKQLVKDIDNGKKVLLVALENSVVLGYLIASSTLGKENQWLIDWAGVLKGYRQKGVATQLLNTLIKCAGQRHWELSTEVSTENVAAIRLLNSIGFRRAGQAPEWGGVCHEKWIYPWS